jgi:hypothetical protein
MGNSIRSVRAAAAGVFAALAFSGCAGAPPLEVYAGHSAQGGCVLRQRGEEVTAAEIAETARASSKPRAVHILAIQQLPDACIYGAREELRRLGLRVIARPYLMPSATPRQ